MDLRRVSCLAALLPFLQSLSGQSSLTFSGNLERVGNRSISLKLNDRRVIDAMLPPSGPLTSAILASQYAQGDKVEIICRPTEPTWEEAAARMQSLQLTSIHLLRRLSQEEAGKLLEARPREGPNLLKGPEPPAFKSTSTNSPELDRARTINLDRLTHMPNFVADEFAKRYRSAPSGRMQPFDTVTSEISFQGRRAQRTRIKRNGEPWNQRFDDLPGYKWYEGFDTEISPLLDSKCPTTIEFRGRRRVRGRHVLEYEFASPVDGCFPFLYFNYERFNAARSGRFFVDDPAGNVLEMEDRSDRFPEAFEFQLRDEHVIWDYVKIADASYLLPVHADFAVTYRDGTRYRVEVEYRNHRHFEASSAITFQ